MKGYQENDSPSRNQVLIKGFVAINLPRLPPPPPLPLSEITANLISILASTSLAFPLSIDKTQKYIEMAGAGRTPSQTHNYTGLRDAFEIIRIKFRHEL